MIFQWEMKELVTMKKRNFKIKVVVQSSVMIKIVMIATYDKQEAGIYKLHILKENISFQFDFKLLSHNFSRPTLILLLLQNEE